jgi:phytoene dehydrogenase-like protein
MSQTIVVGAGVAGLVAARTLQRAGRQVTVFEAGDGPGGRVRSDAVDGYILDRGFQVLFSAYPAVQRQLDLEALQPQAFDPGALIVSHGRRHVLTDPLRDRDAAALAGAVLTPLIPLSDKLRTLALSLRLRGQSIEQILSGEDRSSLAELQALGFSRRTINRFFRPFYGGIFLDRSLATSAKCFRFNFKMLSDGDTIVPAHGMGAISTQLAGELTARGALRLNRPVAALLRDGEQVIGVRLTDGSTQYADSVILATAAPVTAALSGLAVPPGALTSTCVWIAGDQPLFGGKKLLLHAAEDVLINSVAPLSAVAPSYAPPGRHLYAVALLGTAPADDAELTARVFAELRLLCADRSATLSQYRVLRIDRIAYAQFPQPPGLHPTLPDNRTAQRGLYLAGELTEASSINAAMISGELAAAAVLQDSGG